MTAPHIEDDLTTLYHGDSLHVLRELPDASVHAIVCDPPYGLGNATIAATTDVLSRWLSGEREYTPSGSGFMGAGWDAFVPPPALWDECLRVLVPGGHLLAFAGTRTFDLMGLAVRLAGFEIRDSVMWAYGSGMPHGQNISKAIDRAGGVAPEVTARTLREARQRSGMTREELASRVGCTASSIRDWEEGRARAKGKPVEWLVPSPQYRGLLADVLGYTTDERRVTGTTTDRRGDGTVYGLGMSGVTYSDEPMTQAGQDWQGWSTTLKPSVEPVLVARKPVEGTVVNNVLMHGAGALNVDACRSASGRWPSNIVLDEKAAQMVDEQSGRSVSRKGKPRSSKDPGEEWGMTKTGAEYDDEGGASRFFVRYVSKPNASERVVVDGVQHPTVKPLELMRWMVRLVTPVDGVVLDPFAGSGTTLEAARLEGRKNIGVERESSYLPLIMARVERS